MATMWETVTYFTTVWGILCIYSYTYKDNPFWKWATNTLVAGYIAYSACINIDWLGSSILIPMTKKVNVIHLIAILVGFLWYFRFWKKYFYIYRYALAISVGSGIGITIAKQVNSNITSQIASTMLKLYGTGDLMGDFNNIIIVVAVFSTMTYFLFTIQHKGAIGTPIGWISKVGRWMLIITFGVQFGNVLNSRMALLIGTVYNLTKPEHKMYFYALATIILAYLIGTDLMARGKAEPTLPTTETRFNP